jgi:hypothetical protein
LSARYSNSPSLRLAIGNSRALRLLHGLFCLLCAFTLYRLSQRGYPLLALLLLPAAILCCRQLARQRHAGARINWHRGEWTLEQGANSSHLNIHPGSTCLPWVVYLAWVESATARRSSVFLFPDSAPAEQLRGLRVRLALER